jgi:tetratricopeptide (TPR) repeat protein
MKRSVILALVSIGAVLITQPQAMAAGSGGGGGGGGGFSSSPGAQIDVAKYYQEGVQALQTGDFRSAVAKLREAARGAPDAGAVQYAYALALIGNGEGKIARRPLERAVRDAAAPADAHFRLGELYLADGKPEKAKERLDALEGLITRCNASCDEKRRTQLQTARDALKDAIEKPANPAPANTTGWSLPSIGEGRAAFAEAVGLINAERFREALPVLARAGEAIGPHPDILTYQGFAHRKLGQHAEALAFYEAALRLNPDHRGATEYLGEFFVTRNEMDKARAQLAKLERLCPFGCAERDDLARMIAAHG